MASEGKGGGDDGGGGGKGDDPDVDVPTIDVTRISVEPNNCTISERLDLELDFSTSDDITNGVWEVKYMVDSIRKRHIIVLGASKPRDYPSGEASFAFGVDSIDVSGIKPSALSNAGLLIASLSGESSSGDRVEIIDVNLVVQVSKDGDDFVRCVFNPLE